MKLAIVHDYLNQYGGAERVVEALHEMYPDAPIYTSIYTPNTMPASFGEMDIRTTFMQRFPFKEKYYKYYLLFYPRAMESLDVSGYDIILSSSSSFAKGVRVPEETLHLCYCYTPTRFIWNYDNYIQKEGLAKMVYKILPLFIKRLKKWDLKTVAGVDSFIAISRNIQEKIQLFYERDSVVIYPPVDISMFDLGQEKKDYFLVVSRLNSYKNIDLVIKAFNANGQKLKIVGAGPYKKALEKMAAGKNIEFLGKVTDDALIRLYGRCKALIFPGEEDFGIAPLEAQASGRPVIAFARGGSLETIIEGQTGLFFAENNTSALLSAISRFTEIEKSFDPKKIRENALKFSKEVFKQNIRSYVDKQYESRGHHNAHHG